MASRRDHGLHNREACDLLIASGSLMNDWVVTTAFYSALHLVHHHIFPLPVIKRVFNDFEAYYNSEHSDQAISKHTVTKNLVRDHLPSLTAKYNWLFKECHNARYRTYNVHLSVAKKAREHLQDIEEGTDE